jgi:hypothetical protein
MNRYKEMENLAQAKETKTNDGKNPKREKTRRKGKGVKMKPWVTNATNEAAYHTFLTLQRLMLESVISLKFMRWVD